MLSSSRNWPKDIARDVTAESEQEICQVAVLIASAEAPKTGINQVIRVENCSSEHKLFRVTAWVLRFLNNTRNKVKITGGIHVEEIKNARDYWIMAVQTEFRKASSYKEIVESLGAMERDGIVRCFGRLNNSDLPPEAKSPILLPRNHPFTNLMIRACHARVLHGGTGQTLAELRKEYWVPTGRQQVEKVLKNCMKCLKIEGRPFKCRRDGQLPAERATKAMPFQRTGVDFAGPLYTKQGGKMEKIFILIFACAVTRAIQLRITK